MASLLIEWPAIGLTLTLASVSTLLLLALGTPLAWWLSQTNIRFKSVIEALTAMPLVLPPTVLGFYLLILMQPDSVIGGFWLTLSGSTLTFNFSGLVLASVIYSLPFMVQPLQAAFEQIGKGPLEAAASLRAAPLDTFLNVVVPQSRRGFLTAMVLTFAHTIGEFGVVLMVGGNIPGRTRVISIAIYENVETLNYSQAHWLSGLLITFSFLVLLVVYASNKKTVVKIV